MYNSNRTRHIHVLHELVRFSTPSMIRTDEGRRRPSLEESLKGLQEGALIESHRIDRLDQPHKWQGTGLSVSLHRVKQGKLVNPDLGPEASGKIVGTLKFRSPWNFSEIDPDYAMLLVLRELQRRRELEPGVPSLHDSSLNDHRLLDTVLHFPELAIQRAVARETWTIVESHQALISLESRKLTTLEQLNQIILRKMLSGELPREGTAMRGLIDAQILAG